MYETTITTIKVTTSKLIKNTYKEFLRIVLCLAKCVKEILIKIRARNNSSWEYSTDCMDTY